jgi:hypothetical protein
MQLGAWGPVVSGGKANMSNLLYFKFGGVVGFTNVVAPNGSPWLGASAVKFNPPGTVYATTVAGYQSIPAWNGTDLTDGYISSTSYHTSANVKAGRGDPCKLVGLTVAQIQAGGYDNKAYRLPTKAENVAFASSPTYVDGAGWASGTTPTAGIHTGDIGTSFLPVAGQWNYQGYTYWVGLNGSYWSSRANDSTNGNRLSFSDGAVSTSEGSHFSPHYSLAVRCVPQ